MERILIIEDDVDIASIERDFLEKEGYEVAIEKDGNHGQESALNGNFDLILLDLMLPGLDGLTICKNIRDKIDTPILMVTARASDVDKIKGLHLGADDYIEKPFSPMVLVAKVKSHLASYHRIKKDEIDKQTEFSFDDVYVNLSTHRVYKNGNEVELKNKEFELLAFFLTHKENLYSRDELYENVWGGDSFGDSFTVVVHINRLREKLEEDPSNPKHIMTVRGAGYRFQ